MGEEKEWKNNFEVFYELKRRLKLTRKARIRASKRLRSRHEFFEKITYFYSLLILILTIWFLNVPSDGVNANISKVLLILSLSITFFTMYLNIKNYKERANNFETNYQHLDILLNKIERMETQQEITDEDLKGLHREYEKLLIEKENHKNIDYMTAYPEHENKFIKEVSIWKIKDNIINFMVAIFPLLIVLVIYLSNIVVKAIFNQ